MHALTSPQLRTRIHDHVHLFGESKALAMQKGRLDIKLLKDAGLHVEPELEQEPVVNVVYDHMHLNVMLGRGDPIYRVYRAGSNAFIGHYAAAAFSELSGA